MLPTSEPNLRRQALFVDSAWYANCDEAGGVRFEDLLGGEYTIRMRCEIRREMRIQVPSNTVVFVADGQ